jgi:hypothetical protein
MMPTSLIRSPSEPEPLPVQKAKHVAAQVGHGARARHLHGVHLHEAEHLLDDQDGCQQQPAAHQHLLIAGHHAVVDGAAHDQRPHQRAARGEQDHHQR